MAKTTQPDERVLGSIHRFIVGTVELKFEAGRIVLLRKAETLKPDVDDFSGQLRQGK